MDINGTVIVITPVISGESTRGSWQKCGFAIETSEEYPKKVYFSVFGEERVKKVQALAVGEPVQVHFSPESREFNDKWYTDLRAYSITGMYAGTQANADGNQSSTSQAPSSAYPNPPATRPVQARLDVDDDLPF